MTDDQSTHQNYSIHAEYVFAEGLWRYYIYLNGQMVEKSDARYIDDLSARHAARLAASKRIAGTGNNQTL